MDLNKEVVTSKSKVLVLFKCVKKGEKVIHNKNRITINVIKLRGSHFNQKLYQAGIIFWFLICRS